jgi:catechol 2,3-dioxygenase-like lactoylglutathione lyase family enzyme
MPVIQPHNFHRLALAVRDIDEASGWLTRVFGATPISRAGRPTDAGSGRNLGNMAGTDTTLLWVGGYPVILLTGGAVARFLERRGPGVQSFAWEVDDNWAVEHIVRDAGIGVTAVNVDGRFFFMHPRDTYGLLLEWCDGRMPRDTRPPMPVAGLVQAEVAWVTGVVADADAVAAWLSGFVATEPVAGNAAGPAEVERTVDLAVGDITLRLVTPLGPDSRYAASLDRGPGVHSFTLRVPDLDAALADLDREGIPTVYRHGGLAATEPASTLGFHLDWTE